MSNTVIAKYTAEAIRSRLSDLLVLINKAMEIHYQATFARLKAPTVGIDGNGKKYIRVSTFQFFPERGKSYPEHVYFFVDLTNGNLLKPASYKTPELKNPRGNIFDKDILTKMSPYGVKYVFEKTSHDNLQAILGVTEV